MPKKTDKKCALCGDTFPASEIKSINGKNYCPKCFVIRRKEIDDLNALKDYINEKLDPGPGGWPLIQKQINQYQNDYGMKCSGMKATLMYLFEYTDEGKKYLQDERDSGIAFIPYWYKAATKYWETLFGVKHVPEEDIDRALNPEVREVTLYRSDIESRDREFEEKKKIREQRPDLTMDDIEDDEFLVDDLGFINLSQEPVTRQELKEVVRRTPGRRRNGGSQ